jgi:hypothetical protein
VFAVLGAFIVYKYRTPAKTSTAQAAVSKEAPANPLSEEQVEDASDHLRNARTEILKAADNAKRAQTRVRQVGQGLQQNYLELYRQRLEFADRDCEFALRSTARALEELEFAQTNLTKGRRPQ